MGAKISTLDNNNNNNSNSQIKLGDYDLQDITPLGKKPVTPINIKTLIEKKKVYPKTEAADKLKDIADTFDDIVDKKNDRINSLIRYETLLMNYSNKNREVLKELDNRTLTSMFIEGARLRVKELGIQIADNRKRRNTLTDMAGF